MKRRTASIALALLLAPSGLFAQSKLAVQKLADGVWAAHPDKGANVGWFLLGDGVVAIDSGADNGVASEVLKQIAETTGGKPVRYVVVTHAHADHAAGLRTFAAAGAQIVCAEKIAGPLLTYVTQVSNDPADPLAKRKDAKPTVLTVSERLSLFDGLRRAEVQWLGPAHTKGDLVVILPAEKILFVGDLAPNGRLPDAHLDDADVASWVKVLPRLAAAPVDTMVPGHGEIGPRTGIADSLAYLRKLDEVVHRLVRSGIRDEQLDIQLRDANNRIVNVPLSQAHMDNARALFRREKGKLSKPAATPAPARKKPAVRSGA